MFVAVHNEAAKWLCSWSDFAPCSKLNISAGPMRVRSRPWTTGASEVSLVELKKEAGRRPFLWDIESRRNYGQTPR
ncbi:MAG: hypothetical protein HYV96_17055 [Opitutae bacterium]|nr:hypothetical protein [Opitutae bacterium]